MPHDALLRYLEEVETAIGTLRDSDLQTFPDHKHHQTGIDCSEPPSILKAVEEASEISSRYARS